MENIFLMKGFLNQKNYYMTSPADGQSLEEFINQKSSKNFCLCWQGHASDINVGTAKAYVDMSLKNADGQQLYRDYRYPNDTVHSVQGEYESIMTAVEALSSLKGSKVNEVVIFHD